MRYLKSGGFLVLEAIDLFNMMLKLNQNQITFKGG
jgi:hypothetical protein